MLLSDSVSDCSHFTLPVANWQWQLALHAARGTRHARARTRTPLRSHVHATRELCAPVAVAVAVPAHVPWVWGCPLSHAPSLFLLSLFPLSPSFRHALCHGHFQDNWTARAPCYTNSIDNTRIILPGYSNPVHFRGSRASAQ